MNDIYRTCGHCKKSTKNAEDLVVWQGDDGYGWLFGEEIRCKNCPKPENVFIDEKIKYHPDMHDKKFGYTDYDVPYGYIFCGPGVVLSKCVECACEFDASEVMEHEYLPEIPIEGVRGSLEVLFCRDCYRERRKQHKEDTPIDNEKLALYFPAHSTVFSISS